MWEPFIQHVVQWTERTLAERSNELSFKIYYQLVEITHQLIKSIMGYCWCDGLASFRQPGETSQYHRLLLWSPDQDLCSCWGCLDGCQLDKSLCSYVFDAKLWISFKVFRLAVSFRMYCWVSHLLACIANMCCTVFSSALSNLQCLGRLSTISWWISWLWLSTIFITTNSVPSPFAARRMANGHPILYVHCCGHHFAQRLSVLHYDSYVLANSI